MLKNPHKILIILNLLIIALLYGDLVTNSYAIPEQIDQIYSTKQGSGKRYEIHNYLKCVSGNKYEIGIVPDIQLDYGKSIVVIQTDILSKTKSIKFEQGKIAKNIYVSFLLDPYICVFVFLTLIFSLINIFYTHALGEFVLCIFSVFIYIISIIYLCYL